jgi:TonB family protein
MSPVKPKAEACAAKGGRVQGRVVIQVQVNPAGEVASASVAEAAGVNAAVASCIASAARNAQFAATKSGGSFPYPFKF